MLLRKLRNWLLAGLVVLLPVWLTVSTIFWLVSHVDTAVAGPLTTYLPDYALPGIGILIALLLTVMAGWLTTHFLGRQMLNVADRAMLRIPVARSLYSAVKQVTDALLTRSKDQTFTRVVMVEVPRPGVYALGFVAGDLPETELLRVWVPLGPNPSGGQVLLLPLDQVVLLPMQVEDGLKMVVSAGVLLPPPADVEALAAAVGELRARRNGVPGGVFDG
jgi:uncharacterized membrane protein